MVDEKEVWHKFYAVYGNEELELDGFDGKIPFEIYDGHAVCYNYNGHRFDLYYPMLKAIRESSEMSAAIMDVIDGISKVNEITPLHSLLAYNTLYLDGNEVI